MIDELRFTFHDEVPAADAAVVDAGLDSANRAAAPLGNVRALAVFARAPDDRVIGGAIGRTWGVCCELQQLWVAPERRGRGIGAGLVRVFEERAAARGCTLFYLETFSFQARPFYEALGYRVVLTLSGFAEDVSKYTMTRETVPA